jgi:hypothetical protein
MTKIQACPFKADCGDGILFYALQVTDPTFDKIDRLKNAGWQPSPPWAAAKWDLQNSVLFAKADRRVALAVAPPEVWDAAPNLVKADQ